MRKIVIAIITCVFISKSVNAQTNVTTGGQKYTLVEQGTGTSWPYCPDGAQVILQKILSNSLSINYPRAIAASFHNGPNDSMVISGDPFNVGTGYITSFPEGTVDRTPYLPQGPAVAIKRLYWPDAVAVQNALAPRFDISLTCFYDSLTRIINVKLKATALVAAIGDFRVNLYVKEDSISSALVGYNQTLSSVISSGSIASSSVPNPSWFLGQTSPLSSPTIYCHMDVVRKILAGGGNIWGDLAFSNPSIGDSFVKTYSDTIPVTYRGRSCYAQYTEVIGIVQKYGASPMDRPIENCIESKVRFMSKEPSEVPKISVFHDIQVFPNPAQDRIVISGVFENHATVTISVSNAWGMLIYSKMFEDQGSLLREVIPLYDITDGVYFLNIKTKDTFLARTFTIIK